MTRFDRVEADLPEHLAALVSRAQLRLNQKNVSGATADLDLADRTAPRQADVRFTLAGLFESADLLDSALAQFDLWIDNHPDDSKMAGALNGRCWIRALQGDYDKAINDYDDSLKLAPRDAWSLYGRGVAKLRKKRTAEGQADIEAAERFWPKIAGEFQRRGIVP